MTYFNPKVFNVKNLTVEDAKEIGTADFMVSNVLNSMLDDLEIEDTDIISTMRKEIYTEALQDFAEMYECERREMMVSMIDNYDHDVEEVEVQEPEWDNPFNVNNCEQNE